MASVLLGLGGIYFYAPIPEVDTPNYEVMARDRNYTWIPSQRLSRSPAMQFTGPGEEVVTIEGRLFPHHFGGLSTITLLDEAGKSGKPFDLVRFYPIDDEDNRGYGGNLIGQYVIRRLRNIDQKIGADGIPHRVDFSIELASYGEDSDLSTGSA